MIKKLLTILFTDKNLSGNSSKWANWMSKLTIFTCKYCVEQHGKIVDISILDNQFEVLAHPNCQCVYVAMRTKTAGTATNLNYNGADAHLIYLKNLPDYYITKKQARQSGWCDWKGNLNQVLPNKMIGGDTYKNREGRLPDKAGRTWYEADINYTKGYRNQERILYSNDGLVFVTYDHYQTFFEVTR